MLSWHKRVVEDKSQEKKGDEPTSQQEPDPKTEESKKLGLQLAEGQKELENGDVNRSANGGDLDCLPVEQWEAETSAVSITLKASKGI
jgi:hypothetical protein